MKDRHGGAVPKRHRGADGDEGVHVARAVFERAPGSDVEPLSGPELHGSREDEQQDVEPEWKALSHRRNRHEPHDERGNRNTEGSLSSKFNYLSRISRNLLVAADAQYRISRVLDGGPEVFDIGYVSRVLDGGALGREVYAGGLHSVNLTQGPLDVTDARGAGHPADVQRDIRGVAGRVRPAVRSNRHGTARYLLSERE